MMDVRQKTAEFAYEGRVYDLTCNMNVFADVQCEFDGDLKRALRSVMQFRTTMVFLAAMLNDAAETQDLRGEDGKLLHVSARELGKRLTLEQTTEATRVIIPLIAAAMPEADKDGKTQKN